MDAISEFINALADKDNSAPGDYIDSGGFLTCGKCRTRKQAEIQQPFGTGTRKMPCVCECRTRELAQEAEEKKRQDFQRRVKVLRRDGLTDLEYLGWTFEKDDRRQAAVSDSCRKYVNDWEQMRADNVGLLFFGGVGTGKSFYACCIANELLEKCVPALVTNFPRILNKLQSAGWGDSRNELLDRLQQYELVVIDDLGVERGTEYAMEQIYMIVDTRYRSGKPLIVTTNLTPAEIGKPGNIGYERIYDRILQNSIPVKMAGASRRVELAAQKRKKYRDILGL